MDIRIAPVQGEEREGYYVQPLIKRFWAVQLDFLKEIDTICKRHHIKYFGWGGTLLGAVRHRGFVPWDDDIDIAMLREDYERFRHYAKEELPVGRKISEYHPNWITVFNADHIWLDQKTLDESHGCPYTVGIDIFCLDRIPPDKTDVQVQLNMFLAVTALCLNWDLPEDDGQWKNKSKWEYLKEIEELTGHHFDPQSPIREQLYFLGDRIAAMYWDTECDDVTVLFSLGEDSDFYFPKTCFDKIVEVPFENRMLPISEDYDLICRALYGDSYMIPIKKGKHDHLKDQVERLRRYFEDRGEAMPAEFDMTFD